MEQPWATEIDGLRRALAAPERTRVPPHVTLVSPINLRDDDLAAAVASVDRAAAEVPPMQLDLGPATTFLPVTPTVHLAVDGPGVSALRYLRAELVGAPPLDRPDEHEFVPHVTLIQELLPIERIDPALEVLAGWSATITADRVHVLRHAEDRVWRPIHEARFSAPAKS